MSMPGDSRVVADVVVAETDGGANICPAAAHLASSWRTWVLIANRSLIESISQASPPSCQSRPPRRKDNLLERPQATTRTRYPLQGARPWRS